MPDCAQCGYAIGYNRRRCAGCGACEDCCECDFGEFFDPAELGLDPEEDVDFHRRRHA